MVVVLSVQIIGQQNGDKEEGGGETKAKQLPSLEFLQECFDLTDKGLFWKERPLCHFKTSKSCAVFNAKYSGKLAGYLHKNNKYTEVGLDGVLYKIHRIIYKLAYKEEPIGIVDHVDGNKLNNLPNNLRLATSQENARNSNTRITGSKSSKYKGVSAGRNGSWISCLTIDDTLVRVVFDSEEEAALDYHKRASAMFGEFYRLCPNTKKLLDRSGVTYG